MSLPQASANLVDSGSVPVPARLRDPAPAFAIAGSSEVSAQVERHLTQCRRHRALLALLCVSVLRIEVRGEPVPADLEHQVRDEVAHRMRSRVRGGDRVLRESDRDTCVLLPGATDDAARRIADRFMKSLTGAYRIGDVLADVTVRVGYASHPQDGSQASDLLHRATGGTK